MIEIQEGNSKYTLTKNGDICFKLIESFLKEDGRYSTKKEVYFGSMEELHRFVKEEKIIEALKKELKKRTCDMSSYKIKEEKDGTFIIGKLSPKGAFLPKNYLKNKKSCDKVFLVYQDLEKVDSEDSKIIL